MKLTERVAARMRPADQSLSWPVGRGSVEPFDGVYGHDDSRFSPEFYGDYLATSNEIYSVVSLRARLMAGLRLNFYRGRNEDKRFAGDSPVAQLLRTVNPHWTFPRLQRIDEMSMGVWGESFWACERQPGKPPTEIWWVKPTQMRPVPDEKGYIAGYLYEPTHGGEAIPFRADEVVWFRYPNPIDEFSALSPLAAARLAADTGQAMMKQNKNLNAQGLQMGGLIVPPADKVVFSPEQADDLERLLDRKWSKPEFAKRWAVLRFDAQFKSMQVTPKDAEFLGGLGLSLRQVCNAYGIPSPLLNDAEHATLANVREYERWAWTNALQPDGELRAAEIEEQLIPMFGAKAGADHAEYDFSKVPALQESASEAWGRERQAIEVGALTVNEWRKSKGMPPVEWGDKPWMPVNKSQIGGEGATTPAEPAPEQRSAPSPTLAGEVGREFVFAPVTHLHVPVPEVTVNPPAPVTYVAPAEVTVRAPVTVVVPAAAAREKTVERDLAGNIVRTIERDLV